jgi:hypothetical protein
MQVFRLSSEVAISARITTYLGENPIPVRLPVRWMTISKMYLRKARVGKSVSYMLSCLKSKSLRGRLTLARLPVTMQLLGNALC